MNPFKAAVDAAFIHHGLTADLEQGALVRSGVRILPYEEDQYSGFQETRLKSRGGSYEIRQSDFEGFSPGAVLILGGERRKIQGADCEDSRRLKLILRTVSE